MLKIDGWKDAKIQDVLSNRTEKFDPKTTDEELNYIGLEHINQDSGTINGYGLSSDTTSMKTKFYEQDILYGKLRPYLRKYWHADFAGVCSTEILALKPKANNDSKFCYYLIQDDEVQNQVAAKTFGTKMPRTSWNELKQYEVSVPPLPEQKKIVKILSAVDCHIDEVDGMIEDLKELKKGLMQKLLTEGIGHTEFKDSEVGRIPVEWEVKKIKEFAVVKTGNTPKTSNPELFGYTYPWVTPSDIEHGREISVTERGLSKLGYAKTSVKLPANTVLVTCIASIGKNAILRSDGSCNQQINAILPNETFVSEYVYYWITHNVGLLQRLSGQTAVPILNKSTFEGISIALPAIDEQCRIADILISIDKRIEMFEDKASNIYELKKGLMQQLLTGKTRVKIDN